MLALGWNSPQGVESPHQRRGSDSWPFAIRPKPLASSHTPAERSDLFLLRFSKKNSAPGGFFLER